MNPEIRHLHLRESATTTLPSGFTLVGAVQSDAGEIAAWSSENSILLVDPMGKTVVLPPRVVLHPIGVSFGARGEIIVVDSSRREVIELTHNGMSRTVTPIRDIPIALTAAALVDGAWYVGGRDSSDSARFDVFEASAHPTQVWSAPTGVKSRLSPYLTGAEQDLILTFTDAPFEVMMRSRGTGKTTLFQRPPLPDSVEGRKAVWRGLPAIPLDSGIVQTFADLTSNRRILVLYSQDGNVVRATAIDAPLGFMASNASRHSLLAARRTDRVEVVVYQWNWGNN